MNDTELWVAEIERRRESGVGLEFSPDLFSEAVGADWPNSDVMDFLNHQVDQGNIQQFDVQLCPKPTCHQILDSGMLLISAEN